MSDKDIKIFNPREHAQYCKWFLISRTFDMDNNIDNQLYWAAYNYIANYRKDTILKILNK